MYNCSLIGSGIPITGIITLSCWSVSDRHQVFTDINVLAPLTLLPSSTLHSLALSIFSVFLRLETALPSLSNKLTKLSSILFPWSDQCIYSPRDVVTFDRNIKFFSCFVNTLWIKFSNKNNLMYQHLHRLYKDQFVKFIGFVAVCHWKLDIWNV